MKDLLQSSIRGAPNLILALLVAEGRTMSLTALTHVGALLGFGDVAIRVALTRLVAQGKLARSQRGEYYIPEDRLTLHRPVREWRQKQRLRMPWRGGWVAVHDTLVQRSNKVVWRRHHLALRLWGMAELQPGLWLRPDNLRGGVEAQRQRLLEVGLADLALVLRLEGLDAATQAKAEALWDVATQVRLDRECIERLTRSRAGLAQLSQEAAARESFILGRNVVAHLVHDPLLPPQIMPLRERRRLLRVARAYHDQSSRIWTDWLAQLAGG